jgi:AraC-like DNA-binding protein
MASSSTGDDAVASARFATTSPDEAHEALTRMHVEHRFRTTGTTENFSYYGQSASTATLAVDHVRYATAAQTETDPIDYVFCPVVLEGAIGLEAGGDEIRGIRGDVWMNPIGTPLRLRWPGFDLMVLRMPLEPVQREASAIAGIDPIDLRFDGMKPMSPSLARHWRSTVAYLHRELNAVDSALANPVLLSHMTQLVARSLLAVFPNTTMTPGYVRSPGKVKPATLRRATAFIESHAGEPLTTSQIAEAAGITARALQLAFARHYDTTPMGFVRRVRLAHAHHELRAADPTSGATVAAIGQRWGFASASRFAACYGEIYGVPPSHTLRT